MSKVFGKAGLGVVIKYLTGGVLDETLPKELWNIKDASKKASSGSVDAYISERLLQVDNDKEALKSFKECLARLGDTLGGDSQKKTAQVVFIIDELDRCKPKFALSLIESIKHLFSVPNITFLLVMHRAQMEEAVRCEYGRGVDASKYLQKFVSIWTSFPNPRSEFSVPKKYLQNCLKRMDHLSSTAAQRSAIDFFEELAIHYALSLREIEKSLTNFAIIHNATDDVLDENNSWISAFISIIKVIRPDAYRKLVNSSISFKDLVEEASLSNLKEDWYKNKNKLELCYIEAIPNKLLSAHEEDKAPSLAQGNHPKGSIRHRISTICRCLESFSTD